MPDAELHFITGKGGVGKSTVAASLAYELVRKGEGPVLLIDVQGSGRSLDLLGLKRQPFENTKLPQLDDAWGSRILPRDTFRQYFGLLLSLGKDQSTFAQLTSGLRSKLVDYVLENRVVSAFVDICPGLEPSILLGKLHWEATEGRTPQDERRWRHVVVDAPATGHGVMLFKSTFALIEVFHAGIILKQASRIRDFVRDPKLTHINIVTTAEELPMQEAVEMRGKLDELGLKPARYVVNRCPPPLNPMAESKLSQIADPLWRDELGLWIDNWKDQSELMIGFREKLQSLGISRDNIVEIPELSMTHAQEAVSTIGKKLGEHL